VKENKIFQPSREQILEDAVRAALERKVESVYEI
jgi:hypothetical protein